MKIGILTFHNSNNYGAVLQCFALEQYLEKMYGDVEIIDYRCVYKKQMYKICQMSRQKSLRGNISAILDIPFHLKKKLAFEGFRKQYYKMSTHTYEESNQLRKECPWDCIIVGSDQVWNEKNTKGDCTYLLDFVDRPKLKIAYAASFGKNQLEEGIKEKYSPLLKEIQSISVREYAAVALVETMTHKRPKLVLDPTFLLRKQEWKKYIKPIKVYKSYVLVYTIENSKEIIGFANEIAERLECKVIRIASRTIDYLGHEKVVIPSPEQFLFLIDHAKCVVTDSYHGTILSINFNKPFYVVPQHSQQSNERIRDILSRLRLNDRIIEGEKKIKKLKKIDYELINKQLDQYRLESIQFLKESLQVEEERNSAYED